MGYDASKELFAEWAMGLVIIAIRIYARWSVGQGRFYWDDLCLGFATIFWTFHTVFLYLCTDVYGSNIGLNTETAMQVPDSKVARLREGSIFAFIAWLSYIFMVWSFKGVLLFLYSRLTMGLWQHRLTIGVGIGAICTFFASLFFHLFICMPVHKTWQIKPYPGDNCTIRPLNYIVIETLSIVTDISIMTVPIPLVLTAKIAPTQKLLLCILFSSGIFVMIAACLRAYYSVSNIDSLGTALGWASREALVSVIIVCAPGIKPLLNRWGLFSSFGSGRGYDYEYNYNYNANQKSASRSRSRSKPTMFNSKSGGNASVDVSGVEGGEAHPYELQSLGWRRNKPSLSGESQERIVGGEQGIMVTMDVTLDHEDAKTRLSSSGRS